MERLWRGQGTGALAPSLGKAGAQGCLDPCSDSVIHSPSFLAEGA